MVSGAKVTADAKGYYGANVSGDRLIVMAFAQMSEEEARNWVPRVKHF